MSVPWIYEAVVNAATRRFAGACKPSMEHLDIGAGRGELIRILSGRLGCKSCACDYHAERFEAKDVPVSTVDLNASPLPYPDDHFDLVTSSEVVEHLENYRHLLREAFRVLKPGSPVVVTTPNVLNMNSRVRYLLTGFANLFGPLPVRNEKRYSTGGHITPIPYFYLAHALTDAGFTEVELDVDKVQRTSLFWLVLLSPFVCLGWLNFLKKERKKYKTLTPENEPHVSKHVSWRVLLGRTVVVSAVKPLE